MMLMGSVRRSQLFLEILSLKLRNSFDNTGESKRIPKNDKTRSKYAYPAKRNCLKNSIVTIKYIIHEYVCMVG